MAFSWELEGIVECGHTCDDPWEFAFLLILTFDDRFDDAGMVGAKVDEAVCNAGLYDGLVKVPRVMFVLVGSRTSHSASKKANEAV